MIPHKAESSSLFFPNKHSPMAILLSQMMANSSRMMKLQEVAFFQFRNARSQKKTLMTSWLNLPKLVFQGLPSLSASRGGPNRRLLIKYLELSSIGTDWNWSRNSLRLFTRKEIYRSEFNWSTLPNKKPSIVYIFLFSQPHQRLRQRLPR